MSPLFSTVVLQTVCHILFFFLFHYHLMNKDIYWRPCYSFYQRPTFRLPDIIPVVLDEFTIHCTNRI